MQRIMTLDVELTQPGKKIIQIGAAVYDVRDASLCGTMEIFVNPHEPISQGITELTGITNEDVQHGYDIAQAYERLRSFHKELKPFKNPLVWGSGIMNDSSLIYDEYIARTGHGDENFMGLRVIDAKTLFQSLMIFKNGSYAGGLKPCMKRLGLTFEGREHTALADAKNTFTLWYQLVRMMHDGFKTRK
jgi:inhibitor of KinA sporulation pathway (predicted exonuclease)